jgi:hypothetical protein
MCLLVGQRTHPDPSTVDANGRLKIGGRVETIRKHSVSGCRNQFSIVRVDRDRTMLLDHTEQFVQVSGVATSNPEQGN